MNTFTIAIQNAGGAAQLCRKLSEVPGADRVTPQVLQGWLRRGQVPEGRVWQFVEATGIPPWEVRPDLYDRPDVYWARVARFCGVDACATNQQEA